MRIRVNKISAVICILTQLFSTLGLSFMPLAVALANNNPNVNESENNTIANNVAKFGTAFSSQNSGDAAASLLRSYASEHANSEMQQWLSQFGTAKVKLNLNKNFAIKESSVDWLIPLYDSSDLMFYTQLGARNKDSRNTINIGTGVRIFNGDWLYGFNTFFDNDLTGKNRRLGIGTELWTNYLQLSANGYQRLNSWHQSRDFVNYDERAANGYDVRINGYLPAYPQIGGSLQYEQYFGDNVGLFGKDELQKNPHALTVGINYTPFPLLTVGANYKVGKSGQHQSNFSAQLRYNFGSSLSEQLDTNQVINLRQIKFSRYDLVDRNNAIVLDYKKQSLISLALTARDIQGYAGEAITVAARVNSQHPLSQIAWQANNFIAAGGNIITDANNTTFSLILPTYQYPPALNTRTVSNSPSTNSNLYTLTAIAIDAKGNRSTQSELNVIVLPAPGSLVDGALSVINNNAIADGTATNTIQAMVTDATGNMVAGANVSFSAVDGVIIHTANAITDSNGSATTTLSSNIAGQFAITATINDSSQNVDVTFIPNDTTATITNSGLTVTTNNALANGHAVNSVQAIVTDANGNLVPDVTVTFKSESNDVTINDASVQTDSNGQANTTLTSLTAGTFTITATINNTSQTVAVFFTADSSSAQITANNFTVIADQAVANGIIPNRVQALVTDNNNNQIGRAHV